MDVSQKTKNETTIEASNFTPGPISERSKNTNLKINGSWCSLAVLFTITKIWKQPKCPSADEWIKMWYINTME